MAKVSAPAKYIDTDDETMAAQVMESQRFGKATSFPPEVEKIICTPPVAYESKWCFNTNIGWPDSNSSRLMLDLAERKS